MGCEGGVPWGVGWGSMGCELWDVTASLRVVQREAAAQVMTRHVKACQVMSSHVQVHVKSYLDQSTGCSTRGGGPEARRL
jgi:hypothetical protein